MSTAFNKKEQNILNIFHKDTVQKMLRFNTSLQTLPAKTFFSQLECCLKSDEYHKNIKMGPIVIALDPNSKGSGENIIQPRKFGDYLSSGASRKYNVIIIDYSGNVINEYSKKRIIENPAEAASEFASTGYTIFFISGNRLDIFCQGHIVDCIPDIYSLNKAVKVSNATLPVQEYKKVIGEHFNVRLYKKDFLRYWSKKEERLLVAQPEDIFGSDLAFYMDQFISDGRVDTECRTKWTNDRTDIRVIRHHDEKIFIFEIKWLGKSVKVTYDGKNAINRVNMGIVQLTEYLQAETQAICGVLVIYDARKEDHDVKLDDHLPRDARVDDHPLRFYLISESASKKAEKVVKEYKKKQTTKGS